MNASDLAFICQLVEARSGIALDEESGYLVEKRLNALVRSSSLADPEALISLLRGNMRDDLAVALTESLTTNETSFFRDLHPFQTLEKELIPKLLKSRELDRKIRILSAGCSSGQEAFSIAMTLDAGCPELASWDVEILGVDVSQEMIARCRSGVFKQLEVQRGLPAMKLLKYFTQEGLAFKINDQLQKNTRFEQRNIVDDWPSDERFDIIFLRNVLVYFSEEAKKATLRNVGAHLASDGYLLVGVENAAELDDSFEAEAIGQAIVYRFRS